MANVPNPEFPLSLLQTRLPTPAAQTPAGTGFSAVVSVPLTAAPAVQAPRGALAGPREEAAAATSRLS